MNRETWLHDEFAADKIQNHYAKNDTNVMPQGIDMSPLHESASHKWAGSIRLLKSIHRVVGCLTLSKHDSGLQN